MKHHFIQSQIADWPGPPTFSPTGVTAIQLVGPNQKSSSLIPPHSRSRRVAWNSPPIPRQINRGAHCPTRSVAMHGYRLHSPCCGKTNPGHVSETVRACRAKVKKITTQISMEKLGGRGASVYIYSWGPLSVNHTIIVALETKGAWWDIFSFLLILIFKIR